MHRTGNSLYNFMSLVFVRQSEGSGKCLTLFTKQMHSSDYIYEGKLMNNNYVSKVNNCCVGDSRNLF